MNDSSKLIRNDNNNSLPSNIIGINGNNISISGVEQNNYSYYISGNNSIIPRKFEPKSYDEVSNRIERKYQKLNRDKNEDEILDISLYGICIREGFA